MIEWNHRYEAVLVRVCHYGGCVCVSQALCTIGEGRRLRNK